MNAISQALMSAMQRSDENKQNRSQVNTQIFRSSLDLRHKHDDTPVVRSDEKILLFCY